MCMVSKDKALLEASLLSESGSLLISICTDGDAGAGSSCQDSFKYVHVSLDTRLPASYGPDRNYPPQLLHQTTCIYQK